MNNVGKDYKSSQKSPDILKINSLSPASPLQCQRQSDVDFSFSNFSILKKNTGQG